MFEIGLAKCSKQLRSFVSQIQVLAILAICAVTTAAITYVLYNYTQTLLKERMQERLVAIVATAAKEFDVNDISQIHEGDWDENQSLVTVVDQLERMREANSDITYAYIMRRTQDPNTFAFVADADSLLPDEDLDMNEDGVVDDLEVAPLPGDPFEVDEYPTLRDEAFFHPVAANDLEEDQWSVQLSAYAPIYSEYDEAIAILGIDVTIDDFRQRTQATLLPFMYFIFFLILLLTLQMLILVRLNTERVEVMREIDRQKDELLGIVSHQLATPISSTKWYLEMLHDGDIGKLTGEQKKHIKSIQSIVGSLTDLVSMILDVSRVQLGRMNVTRMALNLNEFFKEILNVIEPKAKEKKIKLEVSIPKKMLEAMLDRRLMRMVTENLLSNAVKYTPNGGDVSLSVKINAKKILITVKDTGCGIPKEDQSKMFQKLYRASNVQKVKGNGFGLYVAKGAVEAQGGTISFVSKEGKGTTFIVELPVVSPSDAKKGK
ncbi:HAMP domain-containing histidine kinase [Candidatus Peregrinibacteria bacterium]|jgi:signal transduction histidine kinase|nr:HAMP domain-containing histidine kinase [Candidatus Peregrinibacteria bacterium]MBT3598869.1 HAMP domain-containing histidine kinase [Candidatus Peregrinibacteria bacterium]MBT4367283.1 HAMP domain-containing histidine kinase [Candidatus Peregrinibacteria bacterium]MBT4585945.1 HAMP domain-containing histidine kinase [Candidatus Peregrinibacteria bacterium]MBT7009423.1 HAMP domain-containing histidine kinase [Candidatus Peregrinibacteria bacterium]